MVSVGIAGEPAKRAVLWKNVLDEKEDGGVLHGFVHQAS